MLVITRRAKEKVHIGTNIEVVFLGLDKDGNCRLGIKAPQEVRIHRTEHLVAKGLKKDG